METQQSKKELRILLLEDSAEDAGLIEYQLRKAGVNFVLKRVEAKEEFAEQLLAFDPEIILSDYNLPSLNGREALDIATELAPDLPFILVSGALGDEKAIEILKSGAVDYILKDHLLRLPESIRRALSDANDKRDKKKAEEELKRLNKELDSFVYSASHDLRAPLTSLMGLINLAKPANDDPKQLKYFEMMEKSIHQLDKLIKNIVDYSRNARVDVNREKIDFKDQVDSILQNLEFMKSDCKCKQQVNISNGVDFFNDKTRIHYILNNLISNAIKYNSCHQKEPRVTVDIKVSEEQAVIKISDNGNGIAEEHQESVFEMFYRASDDSKGSGLGLYIVKESVDALGGHINLKSELGVGSTFTIELPNNN